MLNNEIQYLEVDSSYRDRNVWPDPAEFEIPIYQSTQKNKYDALDPVSNAFSKNTWSGNRFKQSEISTSITITILNSSVGAAADQIIVYVTSFAGNLQPLDDYYTGAVGILVKTVSEKRRIIDYVYLGNDKAKFTFLSPFASLINTGDSIIINDPTSFDDLTNPIFFVPCGKDTNIYTNCILYNMSTQQYRQIINYDQITKILLINAVGSNNNPTISGPCNGWKATDQYSIRETSPIFYYLSTCDLARGYLGYPALSDQNNKTSFILPSSTPFNIDYTGDFLEVMSEVPPFYNSFLGTYGNLYIWFGINNTSSAMVSNYGIQMYHPTIKGFYDNYIIRVVSGTQTGLTSIVTAWKGAGSTYSPGFYRSGTYLVVNDGFILYKPKNETRRIVKYVRHKGVSKGGTMNSIILSDTASDINNYYTNLQIRFLTGPNAALNVLVINYTVETINNIKVKTAFFNIPGFSDSAQFWTTPNYVFQPITAGVEYEFASGIVNPPFLTELTIQPALILPFYKDNVNPFNNISNSIMYQKDIIRCGIELLNIIIPNQLLTTGDNSRLVDYPYLYLEVSNSSLLNQGSNIIYSNNPNSSKAIFRIPIDDTAQKNNSSFLKIDGDGMVQNIMFRYKDNLKLCLKLPSGELVKTVELENFSPSTPNRLAQISALFMLKILLQQQ